MANIPPPRNPPHWVQNLFIGLLCMHKFVYTYIDAINKAVGSGFAADFNEVIVYRSI